jgi:excisionase family DNA binding protein
MEPVYTIPQVAEYLQMSKTKIYQMVRQGKIPCIRIGKSVRIRESDLVEWLEKHTFPDKPL